MQHHKATQDSAGLAGNAFTFKVTRREALERMSAGVLLALGLWPGALQARAKDGARPFRFIVVNDVHYLSPECGEWLAGVVRQMKEAQPEFCLVAGDLTEYGKREHLAAVRDVFKGLGAPVYVEIGNHDYLTQNDRQAYEKLFRRRLNYAFDHRGWQLVGLDSTEGQFYEQTEIQPPTLLWLDDNLRKLDKAKPTVIFTHFPLGPGTKYRPSNADDLLDRFRPFNLQAVFCGHFHGFTERRLGRTTLTTNKCCALKRGNHDNTKEKGFFVCTASEGQISRRFVECPMPARTKSG